MVAVENELAMLVDLLTILPHSTQAQIISERYRVWATLNNETNVGMSADIVLKHGSIVPGGWNLLGVLDGYPDYTANPDQPAVLTRLETAVAGLADTLVGKAVAQLAPVTRNLLGRPRGTYAMTPLMIYRDVSG